MLYALMNKDRVIATYRERKTIEDCRYEHVESFDAYLPYGFADINDWIDGRKVASHRQSIKKLMRDLGMTTRHDFIGMVRCLSLTDTFWMKRADEDLSWDDVSLYRNPFDDVVARIAFDGVGMFGRHNSPVSPEFSTSGTFEKCWVREDGGIFLLKRGSEGASNAGFEPYSERLASDMLDFAGADHVRYSLANYHGKLASKCPLFTSEDVGFVAAHRFFDKSFGVEDVMRFMNKHGLDEEAFMEMVVFDGLMANVDRHAGNYGFLVDNDTGDVLSFAPLFDHNMAFLPYLAEDEDVQGHLDGKGPAIGADFVGIASVLTTSSMRAKLVALKDFEFADPGYGYPEWKLKAATWLVQTQAGRILDAK